MVVAAKGQNGGRGKLQHGSQDQEEVQGQLQLGDNTWDLPCTLHDKSTELT